MATLNNFCGFESGDFSEFSSVLGTSTADHATTVRTGDRAWLAYDATANNQGRIQLDYNGGGVSDAGSGYIIGFAVYSTDFTPGADAFISQKTPVGVVVESSGNVRVAALVSPEVTVLTANTPLTESAWNYIELYFSGYTASASVELFVNGTSVGTGTVDLSGETAPAGYEFGSSASLQNFTADLLYDDLYIMSGCTSAADRLGSDFSVKSYSSGVTTNTDNGSVLDQGTWDEIADVPFNTGVGGFDPSYTTNNKSGDTDTDSGTKSGPGGDADITGATILGAKWLFVASRTNGSNSNPFLRYGNNVDGVTTATDGTEISLSSGTTGSVHQFVSEGTNVPTEDEYFRLGMGKGSGGRDVLIQDAIGCLAYIPAAAPEANTGYRIFAIT